MTDDLRADLSVWFSHAERFFHGEEADEDGHEIETMREL